MHETKRVHIQVEGEQVTAAGVSDIGLLRNENQDSIHLDENGRFILLADGMGGHERGAEASRTIISVLQEFFQPERIEREIADITAVEGIPVEVSSLFSLIDKGIRKSNTVVYEKNRAEGVEKYMGSTLVGVVFTKELCVTWFHVGDSRLYRWRDTTLTQLTKDHSAYAEWVNKGCTGEEPGRNLVTRAIGPREGVIPDMNWEKGKEGDIYILCSDGLNDMIGDDEISDIIKSSDSVNNMTVNLLNAALDAGGTDNISIVACEL
ncbi:MAG: protein phosphatase 2C domain-containing protein [Desulfobacteraceae bacterium]|jgi:protein phosphatase